MLLESFKETIVMQILTLAGSSVSLLQVHVLPWKYKKRTLLLNCDTITGFMMATNPDVGISLLPSGETAAPAALSIFTHLVFSETLSEGKAASVALQVQ